MPTPQQLLAELDADPLGIGYAAPLALGDDTALANLLNARAYRGPVPIAEVAALCCTGGISGGIKAFLEVPIGATDDPPASLSLPTKGVLHNILTLIQIDFRLSTCDTDDPALGYGCDVLISLGVMSAPQKAALLSLGDNRRSRAEVLWGVGVAESDVAASRQVGG